MDWDDELGEIGGLIMDGLSGLEFSCSSNALRRCSFLHSRISHEQRDRVLCVNSGYRGPVNLFPQNGLCRPGRTPGAGAIQVSIILC